VRCFADGLVEHAASIVSGVNGNGDDGAAERDELRKAIRGFVERLGGSATTRRAMETENGFDAESWQRLSGELGLAGLAIDEAAGGQGATFVELSVACEELGRVLLPVPLLGSAVLSAGATTDPDVLGKIAAGAPAALAHESVSARASSGTDGWRITGEYDGVIDGAIAELLVVVADGTCFVVEPDAPGVRRTALPTMDQTRRQARIVCNDTPARRVDGDLERALDLGRVGLAAEAVGGARWCLEATVGYAKTREQFGRPIGSFQALKHRMADMHVAVETAASTAHHAEWAAAHEPARLPLVAAAAKVYCADAYAHVAQETIQLHGGIGFTWEHDAHLHLKRAWSTRQLLGAPQQLRARVAELAAI
jgi:alkylation response protein AidB-like acyl-CoA dehydrogenase